MMGPLPMFHRIAVMVAVLATAVASGVWVAHFTAIPLAVGAGAVIGGVAGLLVAYAAVYPGGGPQAAHARHHRTHR